MTQDEANKKGNEQLDAMDILIEPVYPELARLKTLRVANLRPGRIIPIDGSPLHMFRDRGHLVYMSPASAHAKGVIGCFHYQWLRFIHFWKENPWTRRANFKRRSPK